MISVIIPCYNEEHRIESTVKKIISYMDIRNQKYELIIVDDGSTDNTLDILKKYDLKIIKNRKNSGKGFSVRNGVLNSKGDLILFTDADLSTPIEELDGFLELIKKYDIVIASRKEKDSIIIEKQNSFRVFAGNIFPIIVRLLLLPKIKDTQCGFKLFRKSAIRIFKRQRIMGWAFDVEILFIAKKLGYSIKEKGVTWVNDKSSKVSLVKDSLSMLIEVIKIRLNSFFKKYD